jgi:hypothetical protein
VSRSVACVSLCARPGETAAGHRRHRPALRELAERPPWIAPVDPFPCRGRGGIQTGAKHNFVYCSRVKSVKPRHTARSKIQLAIMTTFTRPVSFLRPALLTLFAACAAFPHTGLAAKAPDSAANVAAATTSAPAIPKSVFDDRAGKDPFFPNRVVAPVLAPEPTKKEIMILKGVTGSSDRRVALINDRTFTKGEAGEIKVGTITFRIRVVDIKERSATIELEGQTNELSVLENLLPLDGRK